MDKMKPDYEIDANGCWLWLKHTDRDGYGRNRRFRAKHGTDKAHRAYYTHAYGPIPDGLTIDHLCGQRSCVNPDHLEAVSIAVNSRRGNATQLNWHAVLWIRALRTLCPESRAFIKDVAAALNVSRFCVHDVLVNRRWQQ